MIPKFNLWNPNEQAKKIKIKNVLNRFYYISGYQDYIYNSYNQRSVALDRNLKLKDEMISKFFIDNFQNLEMDSFVDVGCNNGYFLLLAKFFGFSNILGMDIDKTLTKIYTSILFDNITFKTIPFSEEDGEYEVVIGLSLLHWLLGQYKGKNTNVEEVLNEILTKFKKLSSKVILLELVTSNDPKVEKYGHHDFFLDKKIFEKVLSENFSKFSVLGYTSKSRILYSIWK